MKRSDFLKASGLGLGALFFLPSGAWASVLEDGFKVRMLTKRVGIFTEKGGTILFALTKDGPVVIDAQFPDTAPHLIAEIQKKTSQPFRLLINTHHHSDHSSGNIAFKGLVPHVLAHVNSKRNQETTAASKKNTENQLFPDQVYTDTWKEEIGKEEFHLHYFGAGHTNGDSVVQLEDSKIIHMGDLVFNRRHPFIDTSAGANIANWIKVLEKTMDTFSHKTTYVCGHAREGFDVVVKKNDLMAFRDYLGNLLKFTQAELKAGKTLKEIILAKEIPGSPEWQGEGIERPLTAAYNELSV